ncbi:velvet factor-domain-containing protein [Radiomyces spectabilis]|uniref:velvet factor-domain-containing protein n=1 Tax=Radiomyces spectabilis TaxID=64574 RepID=UPI00221FBD9F|nr:velvet factor-domain-containing protein [Radiomyces spectabilis]KAI8384744.1 velvet factor-domain-containing protein [Radiomyces spectabilis]
MHCTFPNFMADTPKPATALPFDEDAWWECFINASTLLSGDGAPDNEPYSQNLSLRNLSPVPRANNFSCGPTVSQPSVTSTPTTTIYTPSLSRSPVDPPQILVESIYSLMPVIQENIETCKLSIVEQPKRCRMCGFGEKDKRPIDPAPILRLDVFDEHGMPSINMIDLPFYICQASLYSMDMQQPMDVIETVPSVMYRVLIGCTFASPLLLKDLNGDRQIYFAFPELSVRTAGTYRLKFSFIHLTRNTVATHVFSDPFTVYPPKTFPGIHGQFGMLFSLACVHCFG